MPRNSADRPFFLYLAFNAPHFPLQALPEDIARYRDRYDAGWEAVRAARWRRIQDIGLVTGRLSDVEPQRRPALRLPGSHEEARPRRGQPAASRGAS